MVKVIGQSLLSQEERCQVIAFSSWKSFLVRL